jgi:hypothetical protein
MLFDNFLNGKVRDCLDLWGFCDASNPQQQKSHLGVSELKSSRLAEGDQPIPFA